jgi:uncharacterized protein (DUF2062 family)
MVRRWIRQHLPSAAYFEKLPFFHHFKRQLSHPSLWALNRRSVAGGVAAGLFCGLIPGPLQVLGALIWVFLARVNLPVAVVVTFYTNPFTIAPLYLLAVAYGEFLLGERSPQTVLSMPSWDWGHLGSSIQHVWDWGVSLGPALAVGLPALMCTLSLFGYLLVRVVWSIVLRVIAYQKRCKSESERGAR